MTIEMTATERTNRVIVVGRLDTTLVRRRGADKDGGRVKRDEVTVREGRNAMRGKSERLTVQVRSAFGGMFALPIEIEPDVPGANLLEGAEPDTLLAFEGALQLKQRFDARYARDERDSRGRVDRGKPVRELQLLVGCIRAPREDEQRAGSAVWLEGTVLEPPQVTRHPELPTVQLAGTVLRVACEREASYPGLPAVTAEAVEVNVSVPTSHREAERLYRPGNVVRVVGQIDCKVERQGGEAVTAKLQALDAEWAERREALASKPQELRVAEGDYRRMRRRFEEAARVYVLAGHVELVSGEPVHLEETYELRRAFVAERRRRQSERRERVGVDRQRRAEEKEQRQQVSIEGHGFIGQDGAISTGTFPEV
jgi:hypothetical protein